MTNVSKTSILFVCLFVLPVSIFSSFFFFFQKPSKNPNVHVFLFCFPFYFYFLFSYVAVCRGFCISPPSFLLCLFSLYNCVPSAQRSTSFIPGEHFPKKKKFI